MSDATPGSPTTDDLPVAALLHALLTRISTDIPGALGAAISVRHGTEPLTVLVASGLAEHLAPVQTHLLGGPIPDAATSEEPVLANDVFTDPRWPKLTRDAVTDLFPELGTTWQQVRGLAALPSIFDDTSTLVLSAILDRPATSEALRVLARYENIVIATLVVAEAHAAAGSEQMISVLRSRVAIEQAKGTIIAVRHCTSDEAWTTLRRASQQFNVKIRDLAVALVEHLSHAHLDTPEGVPVIVPTAPARHAAELLWNAFTTPPGPSPTGQTPKRCLPELRAGL